MKSLQEIEQALVKAFELFEENELAKAEQLYEECLDVLSKDEASYENALHGLGYVKSGLGKFNEARELYQTLKQKAQEENNFQQVYIALHQLGMVERMAQNYEKAMHYFEEELTYIQQYTPTYQVAYAANYYERGTIALQIGQLRAANSWMEKSYQAAQAAEDPISLACASRGLGEIAVASGESEMAKHYFQQAISAFEEGESLVGANEVKRMLRDM